MEPNDKGNSPTLAASEYWEDFVIATFGYRFLFEIYDGFLVCYVQHFTLPVILGVHPGFSQIRKPGLGDNFQNSILGYFLIKNPGYITLCYCTKSVYCCTKILTILKNSAEKHFEENR